MGHFYVDPASISRISVPMAFRDKPSARLIALTTPRPKDQASVTACSAQRGDGCLACAWNACKLRFFALSDLTPYNKF
jgi:hypothetical protein